MSLCLSPSCIIVLSDLLCLTQGHLQFLLKSMKVTYPEDYSFFPRSFMYAPATKHVIEKHFETRGPVKGYSGFAGRYYCDYQRVPTRKCIITASGHESCKIVSWTLKQACY